MSNHLRQKYSIYRDNDLVAGKLLPSRGFFVHSPSPVRYSRVSWFSMSMFMGRQSNRPRCTTTINRKDIFCPPRRPDGEIRFAPGSAARAGGNF